MKSFITLICAVLFCANSYAQCDATFQFYGDSNDPSIFYFLSPMDSSTVWVDHLWDFGDGTTSIESNPQHSYPADGVYNVCLTLTDGGCSDTQCTTLVVQGSNNNCFIEAFADVSPDSTILYTNGSPDISYWNWNSAGVTLGTEPYLELPDLEPGTYTVCVIAGNDAGCEDQSCVTFVIMDEGNSCQAVFTYDLNETGGLFFSAGLDLDGWFTWSLNGQEVATALEGFIELDPGDYVLCLLFESSSGCIDEQCVEIFVADPNSGNCELEIDLSTDGNNNYSFSASGNDLAGSVIWYLDNQIIAEGYNGTTYQDILGVYELCAEFQGMNGCSSWQCVDLVVDQPDWQDSLCMVHAVDYVEGNTVYLSAEYQLIDAMEVYWDLGNNEISYEAEPVVENLTPGEHTFCIVVTYFNVGCTVTDCVIAYIEPIPDICDFYIEYSIGDEMDYVFVANPVFEESINFDYWTFSDSDVQVPGNPVSYTWNAPGFYEVCVFGSTFEGEECAKCIDVVVEQPQDSLGCILYIDYTLADNGSFNFQAFLGNDNPVDALPVWDFGDGTLAEGWQVNHVFTTGTYEVCVSINNQICNESYCETITVTNGNPTYDLYGELTTGSSTLDQQIDATVYLIEFQEDGGYLGLADSVLVDSLYFQFMDLDSEKTYYLKSKMNDNSALYSAFLPTYFDQSLSWMGATEVQSTDPGIVLEMVAGANPGGPGFIEGYIIEGAGKTEGGLSNVEVVLTDMNDMPVAYTYSDENGYFLFDEVAYGSYWVFTEILNQEPDPVMVTIEGEGESDNYVEFTVDEMDGVSGSVGTSVDDLEMRNTLAVHPNPFRESLSVEVPFTDKEIEVSIMNSIGQTVYRGTEYSNFLQLELKDIPTGIYYLQVSNRMGETLVQKIIKN